MCSSLIHFVRIADAIAVLLGYYPLGKSIFLLIVYPYTVYVREKEHLALFTNFLAVLHHLIVSLFWCVLFQETVYSSRQSLQFSWYCLRERIYFEMYLRVGSMPLSGGQGKWTVWPALVGGQHKSWSHVARQNISNGFVSATRIEFYLKPETTWTMWL